MTVRLRLPAGQAQALGGQTRAVTFEVVATAAAPGEAGVLASQREPSTFVVPR